MTVWITEHWRTDNDGMDNKALEDGMGPREWGTRITLPRVAELLNHESTVM